MGVPVGKKKRLTDPILPLGEDELQPDPVEGLGEKARLSRLIAADALIRVRLSIAFLTALPLHR